MSENVKTLTFVAVALVAAVVAWASRPSLPTAGPDNVAGKPLYPDFKDPLAVTSLEITEFDEATATPRPFQVAQSEVKGKVVWRIPSHSEYPADAKDQVASAAAGLMGLTVLQQVSDNQGDQKEYGVVEPDPKSLKVGDTGVGIQVVMRDKDNKELLSLVIGKTAPGGTDLRYVRKSGQQAIYVVQVKTDKLSTKFENWIERNLLGISTFDISQLWIQDYSVDKFQGVLTQRDKMVIGYNDTATPKWSLIDDQKFEPDEKSAEGGRWAPVKLGDDEEVNAAKLDALKTALDDLKIVDVSRKPEGLSADLKAASDFATNAEAAESLGRCGFYVAKLGNQVELFSNDGEFRVVQKNGVQYVLRFGGIAAETGSSEKKDAKPKEGEEAEKKADGPKLNRYLFVMAEFDPTIIPKPQLEPLPEAKPADAAKLAEGESAEKKADESKPDEKKPDEAKPEDAERQRIEKENKRKQEEYDQKLADGKKKVDELNARFADWYYVISDDVYRKLHLGHDEIVKKKDKPGEAKEGEAKDGAAAGQDAIPGAAMMQAVPGHDHADHEDAAPAGGAAPVTTPAAGNAAPADAAKPAATEPAQPTNEAPAPAAVEKKE